MAEKIDGDLGVVLAQIDAVRSDILDLKSDIKLIKNDVAESCKAFNSFNIVYTREHTRLETTTNELVKDVIKHTSRLDIVEDLIKPLVFQNKIVAGIGVAFALSVVGFLWAIFTHQITLIFP